MEKSPYQSIFLVATVITCVVTLYKFLSDENDRKEAREHRSIQKQIDSIKLQDLKASHTGKAIPSPVPAALATT